MKVKNTPLLIGLLLTLTSCPKNESAFTHITIEKGKVGPITIGMSMKEASDLLSGLEVEEIDAFSFGFDGGGSALLYSYKNKPLVALIPFNETDRVHTIIVLSDKAKTEKGIGPGSEATSLLKAYTKSALHYNELNDWQETYDEVNQFAFVFIPHYVTPDGSSNESAESSAPDIKDLKVDFIIVQ